MQEIETVNSVKSFLVDAKCRGIYFSIAGGQLTSKSSEGTITAQDRVFIKLHKETIIELLMYDNSGNKFDFKAVSKENIPLATSYAQKRLWFLSKMHGESARYNIPLVLDVKGQFDSAVGTAALFDVVERHTILRTVYFDSDGDVFQVIRSMDSIDVSIMQLDLTALDEKDQTIKKQIVVANELSSTFDLKTDVMVRMTYIRTGDLSGIICVNMHHIASDGWSLEVFCNEFLRAYIARAQHLDNVLPPLKVQYADYVVWQNDFLNGGAMDAQLAYWRNKLAGAPARHNLPRKSSAAGPARSQAAQVTRKLSEYTTTLLTKLARQYELTPFMLMHGMLSHLIAKHSNRKDIVIGTPVANRNNHVLESIIGFFVNTVVLRVDTSDTTIAEYFNQIKIVHVEAQNNQDAPFDKLVDALNIPRDYSYNPVFQIMLSIGGDYGQNSFSVKEIEKMSGLSVAYNNSAVVQSKFDLEIDVNLISGSATIVWVYDCSVFECSFIEQISQRFIWLLESLVEAKDCSSAKLSDLNIYSNSEIDYQVNLLNKNNVDFFSAGVTVNSLFVEQVDFHENLVAVKCSDSYMTYKDLNERSTQFSNYLIEHGAQKGDAIGVLLERSIDLVSALLGILKIGAIYVPIDPKYPKGRIDFIVEDAQMKVVLCQSGTQGVLDKFSGKKLMTDNGVIDSQPKKLLVDVDVYANDLAYIIYTSGSTGIPKGVMIEHCSVCNLIRAQCANYGITGANTEVGLLLANISFDASIEQLFIMLLSGNTIVIPPNDVERDPLLLSQYISQNQVTHLDSTPSHLMSFLPDIDQTPLHRIVSGGEAISRQLYELSSVPVFNVYGPTETCVTSHVSRVPGSIGKAISNVSSFVLDDAYSLVPKGCIGELFIGGVALARGYWNRADLTAERFILNPFYVAGRPNSSERLYRTGDLVRYLEDDSLEFLGRMDEQVKLRGLRIELGEIESLIGKLEGVDSCCVIVQTHAEQQILVAYIKYTDEQGETPERIEAIKSVIGNELPSFMMPQVFSSVQSWPLTAHGKIDKKILPSVNLWLLEQEYLAPVTETEHQLAKIWSGLLSIDIKKVSARANFFASGGHSLMAMRLVSAIRAQFGIEFPLQSVFEYAELGTMAQKIDVIKESENESCRYQELTRGSSDMMEELEI